MKSDGTNTLYEIPTLYCSDRETSCMHVSLASATKHMQRALWAVVPALAVYVCFMGQI